MAWTTTGRPLVSGFQLVPPSVDLNIPPPVPDRRHSPTALTLFPHRRVDDVGVGRIDVDVVPAGVLVLVQDLLECASAVGGPEDASFLVRTIRVTECRDEQAIRIARVDAMFWNLLRIAEAECVQVVPASVDL